MDAKGTLGLNLTISDWDKEKQLPIYMTNTYTIKKVLINNIKALMLSPVEELPNTNVLKKQILKIQSIEELPVFFNLEVLSEYRKNNLLENHVPFIYIDKLVYLPFMATYLTNKHLNEIKKVDKFTMSSQLLFIWILQLDTEKYFVSDALTVLSFSNMTLTRAYRQLVSTGLFTESKEGRKVCLTTTYTKKELIEKAKTYFISPVTKTGYINIHDLPKKIKSGESLLCELSQLNPPRVSEYVLYQDDIDQSLLIGEFINPDVQVKLELWNYDPLLFSKDHKHIDYISLFISLLKLEDERVEMALDELLERIERNDN